MKIESKAYKTVIFSSLIAFSYTILADLLMRHLGISDKFGGPQFKTFVQKILLVILIGPIVETFIFQVILYYFIKLFFEKSKYFKWFYIIIAGLLFARSHSYSLYYMSQMFLPGMFLCYMFIYLKERFSYPIIYVILIHSLHNSLSLIYDYYM